MRSLTAIWIQCRQHIPFRRSIEIAQGEIHDTWNIMTTREMFELIRMTTNKFTMTGNVYRVGDSIKWNKFWHIILSQLGPAASINSAHIISKLPLQMSPHFAQSSNMQI